ncbi:MAG: dTDP-4-dehydrorhamnose 3,5-epimerase [Planctomycetes bacterium]|nr:dTDP-4-dehydrorhamnose 3,5-epimerase [Planctomycetota bacterium]
MKFHELELPGVFVIDLESSADERGFFARTFCTDAFHDHGLNPAVRQCSLSFSTRRGTLRGLHWQAPPSAEDKLVRCVRGAAWDVVVDPRPDSPTFRRWTSVELTAGNRRSVYVPAGFAHGFLTLAEETELLYQMTEAHAPDLARGARWDDPAFGIAWPFPPIVISDRDASYPLIGRELTTRP